MLPIKPIGNLNSLDFSEATFFLKLIALSVNLEKFPYYFFFLFKSTFTLHVNSLV